MPQLTQDLSVLVGAAFLEAGVEANYGVVQRSDRPDLAQFQCNGALAAAKAAKANPRAIAENVTARLKEDPRFAKVEIAGPGFINLTLTDQALTDHLRTFADDRRCGVPLRSPGQVVIIDFVGVNIAKAMHVGHLRSTIIGDCLQRLFRFAGDTVYSDVHFGDWGLQMGQLITEVERELPQLPYFDPAYSGPYPETSPVTTDDLEVLYPRASAACKADADRLNQARQATADLQTGRPGYRALWRHFQNVSIETVKRELASLGVHPDWWKGESDADPLVEPMVNDLQMRGVAVESEGALVVPIDQEGDKKEMPPLIVRKSDGGALYETTDLATIIDRVREVDPDQILYVVDQRQSDHFERVFRASRKAALNGKAHLEHVAFGTVNGTDGKPYKTRSGDSVKLFDLIAQAQDEARQRLDEQGIAGSYSSEERDAIANAVGLAAIKFADLTNYRTTNYIFDLVRFTRFEGETGPYLQYQAVRIKSLLRRAEEQGFAVAPVMVTSASERELALSLSRLPDVLAQAESRRAPNVLCDFAFELAQGFSRFYGEHHIMS
ncbi:MAG TPA: arginine--tRNA ligase, partial [Alphaproteobacteria bacterium]|nr:arginine--tRNA ligase [Alphaproteobacteria bacterium]